MSTAVVVGAGVLGAATARELDRRGWDVTLVEQYTPGNVRSGSGGDTRILRFGHGDEDWYTLSAWRSLELWRDLERQSGERLFEPVGVAWFDVAGAGDFVARTELALHRLGIPSERLTADEAARLYPSLNVDDLVSVLLEPEAGVLNARAATRALAAPLRVQTGRPTPADPPQADVVVWACGAWLPKLFPGLIEQRTVRRDVFFLGAGGEWANAPGFCEYEGPYYGHGELGGLGMKVCFDGGGDEVDPDELERLPDPAMAERARAYAARRFPALADAPIVGARACQYDLTADTHFIAARHPERPGWWLAGGTSGHGFKHGPAFAEYLADCIEGRRAPELFHALGPRTGASAGLRTGGR
jgi:glycine/D-amino acid oxidase-like deaminating enzyme